MASVDLKEVTIQFPIYDSRARSVKQALFANLGGKLTRTSAGGRVVIEALRNVTLSFRSGERIGLIGRNGAGKSTLLKVLAGIYAPPLGRMAINGRVATLLDLTMGMDFEATGYDNIVLRGVLLGLTVAQSRQIIPEIEKFSELGGYLALPIRTYSSGMVLRLAFGIATSGTADILLMDEVIGAGDAAFAAKAKARIKAMMQRSKIVVVASHDESVITSVCTRAIVLTNGQVTFDGSAGEAMSYYKSSIQ